MLMSTTHGQSPGCDIVPPTILRTLRRRALLCFTTPQLLVLTNFAVK